MSILIKELLPAPTSFSANMHNTEDRGSYVVHLKRYYTAIICIFAKLKPRHKYFGYS